MFWTQRAVRVAQRQECTELFTLKWLISGDMNSTSIQLCFFYLFYQKTHPVLLKATAQSPGLIWPHLLTRHSLDTQHLPRRPVSTRSPSSLCPKAPSVQRKPPSPCAGPQVRGHCQARALLGVTPTT